MDYSTQVPFEMNSNPNHPPIPMISELGSNFSITPRHGNGNGKGWGSRGPSSPNPFVKKHRPQKSLTEKIRILNRRARSGRETMPVEVGFQIQPEFFSSQKGKGSGWSSIPRDRDRIKKSQGGQSEERAADSRNFFKGQKKGI